jgi:hypothetical protein
MKEVQAGGVRGGMEDWRGQEALWGRRRAIFGRSPEAVHGRRRSHVAASRPTMKMRGVGIFPGE